MDSQIKNEFEDVNKQLKDALELIKKIHDDQLRTIAILNRILPTNEKSNE